VAIGWDVGYNFIMYLYIQEVAQSCLQGGWQSSKRKYRKAQGLLKTGHGDITWPISPYIMEKVRRTEEGE
jgi:hypothetical protein